MGDALQLLAQFSQAAVAAYPALSLSLAYINGSDATTLHFSGALVPQPDDSSIYEIGSITKTFTGTLLANAVASTDLDLSTPVKEIIPELGDSEFPDSITLLSLAAHTSGLPGLPDDFVATLIDDANNSSAAAYLQPYERYTAEDMLEFLANYTEPAPLPGVDAYAYSNLGVGLLGYALEVALGVPYDDLVQEVITGPLAMSDTVCELSPMNLDRLVKGYALKSDVEATLAPELIQEANLIELGDFYEVPAWTWGTNPIRAAGCLRSTLKDMITYVQASLDGSDSIPPVCRTNAATFPPPDPEVCVSETPTIEEFLGYAQQAQITRGTRIPFPQGPTFEALFPDVFAPVDSNFSTSTDVFEYDYDFDYTTVPAPAAAETPTAAALAPGQQAPLQAVSDELGGVGLNWHTEDWSDTSLPMGLKWHDGGTYASSSIVLLSPDLDAGAVLLSNFLMDGETGFSPSTVVLRAVDAWWCEVAGGVC